MPYDRLMDDDELDAPDEDSRQSRKFDDFDCPDCEANNPYDEKFGHNDEVRCYYCGQLFRAQVSEEGRLRLKVA